MGIRNGAYCSRVANNRKVQFILALFYWPIYRGCGVRQRDRTAFHHGPCPRSMRREKIPPGVSAPDFDVCPK
jgi:hypothetical protein